MKATGLKSLRGSNSKTRAINTTLKMKRLLYRALVILSIITMGCSKEAPAQWQQYESQLQPVNQTLIEEETLLLINLHREADSLTPLEYHPLIHQVAQLHTQQQIHQQLISHEGFGQRAQYLQYRLGSTSQAENVAYGYTTPAALVAAWLNSPGHRHNILNSHTHTAISIIEVEGRYWATQIFSTH